MLSSMVLNPHYFSEFSKTELRFYQEYLDNKEGLSVLENINLSLINNELRVPDFIRHNIGDIQTIAEAEMAKVVFVSDARSFLDALQTAEVEPFV
jgi:hypothetical protein